MKKVYSICLLLWNFQGRTSTVTITILSTVIMYWAGETWNRFYDILHQQLPYILVYLTTGALLAFIFCYRVGPPSHPKTLNIIDWILQVRFL